jgi:hypothetical protein
MHVAVGVPFGNDVCGVHVCAGQKMTVKNAGPQL